MKKRNPGNMAKDKSERKSKRNNKNRNAVGLQKTSFIRIKDQLVEKARNFNLLSNVFMSVALNDIPAC